MSKNQKNSLFSSNQFSWAATMTHSMSPDLLMIQSFMTNGKHKEWRAWITEEM